MERSKHSSHTVQDEDQTWSNVHIVFLKVLTLHTVSCSKSVATHGSIFPDLDGIFHCFGKNATIFKQENFLIYMYKYRKRWHIVSWAAVTQVLTFSRPSYQTQPVWTEARDQWGKAKSGAMNPTFPWSQSKRRRQRNNRRSIACRKLRCSPVGVIASCE